MLWGLKLTGGQSPCEPELMYKLFSRVCCSLDELIEALK